MAMNSVSGEVSQPMRNRGIEISILSSEFTRADAVQVALATGVSLHDTVSLLPDTCDIRRAKFVAETACAMGGAGCSLEETVELIGELHPQQVFRQRDSECLPASGMAVSSLQQPSIHEWLKDEAMPRNGTPECIGYRHRAGGTNAGPSESDRKLWGVRLRQRSEFKSYSVQTLNLMKCLTWSELSMKNGRRILFKAQKSE